MNKKLKTVLKFTGIGIAAVLIICIGYGVYLLSRLHYFDHKTVMGYNNSALKEDSGYNSSSGPSSSASSSSGSPNSEPATPAVATRTIPPKLRYYTPIVKVDQKDPQVLNILLLGLDGPDTARANRSDSIIVASIDTRTKTVRLISFMRDQYMKLSYWSVGRKLNEAYVFGGAGNTINALNYYFDLDIQSYAVIDFNNFLKVIDAVGGVDVVITAKERPLIPGLKDSGLQHLNSSQTLAYTRIRKIDSDMQRAQRQRNVILAILKKFREADLLSKNKEINTVLPLITTNLSPDKVLSLALNNVVECVNVQQYTCPKSGFYTTTWEKGYYIFTDFPRQKADLKKFMYGS